MASIWLPVTFSARPVLLPYTIVPGRTACIAARKSAVKRAMPAVLKARRSLRVPSSMGLPYSVWNCARQVGHQQVDDVKIGPSRKMPSRSFFRAAWALAKSTSRQGPLTQVRTYVR